jgi:hypothetical protein
MYVYTYTYVGVNDATEVSVNSAKGAVSFLNQELIAAKESKATLQVCTQQLEVCLYMNIYEYIYI